MQHSRRLWGERLFRLSIEQRSDFETDHPPAGLSPAERVIFDQTHDRTEDKWFFGMCLAVFALAVGADIYIAEIPWWAIVIAAFGSALMIPLFRHMAFFPARRAAQRAVMRFRRGN